MRQKAIININVGGAVRKFQDCQFISMLASLSCKLERRDHFYVFVSSVCMIGTLVCLEMDQSRNYPTASLTVFSNGDNKKNYSY